MGQRTIGELAKQCGVNVETIRFYQRRGLLKAPPRARSARAGTGGIRRYSDEEFERLRFIRSAQVAGFTLRQIQELLSLDASRNRARVRELATEQIAALEAKISELQLAQRQLQRLASVCGSGRPGPCPIILTFRGHGGDG